MTWQNNRIGQWPFFVVIVAPYVKGETREHWGDGRGCVLGSLMPTWQRRERERCVWGGLCLALPACRRWWDKAGGTRAREVGTLRGDRLHLDPRPPATVRARDGRLHRSPPARLTPPERLSPLKLAVPLLILLLLKKRQVKARTDVSASGRNAFLKNHSLISKRL